MAKRQRHTPEQIISKLREAEVKLAKGTAIAQVCKDLAITDETPPDYPSCHCCASFAVPPSHVLSVTVIGFSAPNLFRSWSPVITTRAPFSSPALRDETTPRRAQL